MLYLDIIIFMKRIFVFIAVFALFSFNETEIFFNAKTVEKSFSKITNRLYINKYEVSNSDYRLFLYSIANNAVLYKQAYPDTSVWKNFTPLASIYFKNPAYANYPLVGITYENALQYCEWLTDTYNADGGRKFKKVIFRLPTREEWTLAANGGNTEKQYPWGTGFIKNSRGMALCNYKDDVLLTYNSEIKKYEDVKPPIGLIRTKITSPVKSFYPSSFGMYSICGNAAEMISEKGIAKGGSYADPGWAVTIASERKYTASSADIGFRVAMEVIEK